MENIAKELSNIHDALVFIAWVLLFILLFKNCCK